MAVDQATILNDFLDKHLLELIIGGGALVGFIFFYRKFRNMPNTPDFIRIFNQQNIKDESLNVRDKLSPLWLYRGEEKIGRILNDNSNKYSYTPTKQELDTKSGISGWNENIRTIVFRTKDFMGTYIFSKKNILRFKEGEARQEGKKLVFTSDMGFTALGNEYVTKTSFKEVSQIIDSEWSKRLFEANVNLMASKMHHMSGESPEYAQQRAIELLKIEQIKAEKQSKIGGLI
jgi:hypothetical protein